MPLPPVLFIGSTNDEPAPVSLGASAVPGGAQVMFGGALP